jgi:hypothetical protein
MQGKPLKKCMQSPIKKLHSSWTAGLIIAVLYILASITPANAQGPTAVQTLTGETGPGAGVVYNLPNLERGQTLYVYAQGISGNLDPLALLTEGDADQTAVRANFNAEVQQAIAAGRDPLEVIPEFANKNFLAWDDDSGRGLDAAFQFTAPADGDYKLTITSAPSAQTFGDFRLLLGIDGPEVLTGQAEPTGDTIAILNPGESLFNVAVEEKSGSLTEAKRSTFFTLREVEAGDTVYAVVEATSGDLAPVLTLENYGGKPLSTGNFSGKEANATIEYTFTDSGSNYRLHLEACCDDAQSTGDYRLVVGLNAPGMLAGQTNPTTRPALEEATEVKVGVKMEQITGVDQKSENFGAVVDLRLEWTDPALAFSPDECQCRFQTFRLPAFDKYLTEKGVTQWPAATLFNQQGRRDSQSQLVVVQPNGHTIYVERFTATLQAPDFDFHLFPFDRQQFYIRLKSVFPEEFYVYTDLEGFSGLGEQLGEEEWIITDYETSVDTHDGSSRFNFGFEAVRHLSFYIFRIFVPVLVIILVSWFTFFLKDYGKRVDVASGNLLLFIAFSFTISDSLPKLGYLTLLDTILVSTFVVTALVIVQNVYLKRLEADGKESFVQRIDKYMIWLYPLAYIAAFVIVTFFFA